VENIYISRILNFVKMWSCWMCENCISRIQHFVKMWSCWMCENYISRIQHFVRCGTAECMKIKVMQKIGNG
jgi:hypothetical protein